ncbi:hypothetical protein LF1_18690 [Rubripirellula obstinata]|uniref:Uncharacterized protein n=1 Tax=Rubripirellula obstinata TaxID=406547 RepID=A0A5B1CDV0_9BACT|nr:hypothetical protein [Rubripirellula obstinata]KAA1259337.1 hypothetical protein LF1_18690 [Rubripirellula obstinata]
MDNIGGLNYKVASDVTGFTQGMVLSRSELAATKREVRKSRSDYEVLEEKLNTVEKAYKSGAISTQELERTTKRLRSETKESKAAQADLAREMERGRATTRSVETATEKYTREVNDLSQQLRRGAISQTTYGRAVARQRNELLQSRAAMAANIPVLGRMQGMVGGMPPAYAAAAVGIAAATAGLYLFGRGVRHTIDRVAEQMAAIDQQAKMASRLGATLDGLSAIRLGASHVSGLENSAVDMGIQRMMRRTAEAAKGMGEAKSVFKQLNLDAAKLAKQRPMDVFKTLADEISKVKDRSEQMRLTFKLFDSEGVGLVSFLRQGSEGVEEFEEKVKALGISLNSIDAALIEQANDAVADAELAWDGLYNKLAVDVAPAITLVANELTTLISGSSSLESKGLFPGLSEEIIGHTSNLYDLFDAYRAFKNFDMMGVVDALSFNTSTENLEKLGKIRDEAEAKAAKQFMEDALARDDAETVRQIEADQKKQASFDKVAAREAIAAKENSDRLKLTAKEREQYDKDAQFRSEMRRAKQIEEQAIADNIEATEAKKLRTLIEQNAQLERQNRLADEAAKQAEKDNRKKDADDEKATSEIDNENLRIQAAGDRITQNNLTEHEKFLKRLQETQNLVDVGAINDKTAERERQAARGDYQKTLASQPRGGSTIRANSTEAYKEIARAYNQSQARNTAEKEALKYQKRQLELTERLIEVTEDMDRFISGV